jgi:hypothetical protein
LPIPPVTKDESKRLQAALKRGKKKNQTQEPTQEAAQAIKVKEKEYEKLKKLAMKRQREDVNEAGDEESVRLDSHQKNSSQTTSDSAKKAATKKGKRPAPVPQGRRKVPTPGDESGCKHRGLRELDVCDKAWITAYVKVGAWLHKKPCIDCAAQSENVEGREERILDASVLLLLKQPDLAYICNCGPIGHKMEEGEEGKDEYQCDMMLCLPCYSERESKMKGAGGRRMRRKTQKN